MSDESEFGLLLHRLRNRLNNISMNSELAKLELTHGNASGDQEVLAAIPCLDAILDACRDCADVAEQLAVFDPVDGARPVGAKRS